MTLVTPPILDHRAVRDEFRNWCLSAAWHSASGTNPRACQIHHDGWQRDPG
jgi:hypothetical protein